MKTQMISAAGLVATIAAAVYMVVQLNAQSGTAARDFSTASVAEVRDAQGLVILAGQFQLVEEDDDDVERKAVLAPTGVAPDARGQAEVEIDRHSPAEQEVEFAVRNVTAGTAYTFVIDGVEVGTATATARGRAELELDVAVPGAAPVR